MELLSDYNYELPPHLIAQAPLDKRSDARLLMLPKGAETPSHGRFVDILSLLNTGDGLVINTSKVMKARLWGQKRQSGGKVEMLLIRPLADNQWLALVSAKGKKAQLEVDFASVSATIVGPSHDEPGAFVVAFDGDVQALLTEQGELPLPPYITRKPDDDDDTRYQTVYADNNAEASVASPTAGLHFDEALLQAIHDKGVHIIPVTLHVGPGTFMPVRSENLAEHHMHGEWSEISDEAAAEINAIKARGGRIVAVGTTATRTLESHAIENAVVKAGGQLTRLFIRPGYRFLIVDALITNFHLPKTTLLMLVSALVGRERLLAAYNEAILQGYRFFSYGDASYLERVELS